MSVHDQAPATLVAIDSLIDEVLLRSLEPTISALDRVLDEGTVIEDPEGAPDGFDGIDRLGSLEHLLASEWLLVGEEPDEFVRRFSERELSYLRRAHVRQSRARTSLVLFDAGPDQLGAPRVAQFACFVALARRCYAAGTPLRWGTLQGGDRHELRSVADLRTLVSSRTREAPSGDPPLDAIVDNCLVVSPCDMRAARQLVLTDDHDEVRAVLIDHVVGTRRTARIPLPAHDDAVRLLRSLSALPPIGTDTSAHDGRPVSNLVFDHGGNKVLARAGDGSTITIFPAPNSPHMPDQRARIVDGLSHLGPVTAAGRVGRGLITATIASEGDEIFIGRKGSTKGRRVPEGQLPLSEPLRNTTLDDPLGQIRWLGASLHVRVGGKLVVVHSDRAIVSPDTEGWRWGKPPYDVAASLTEEGVLVRAGATETLHVFPASSRVFGIVHWHDLGTAVLRVDEGRRIVAAAVDGTAVSELCITEAEVLHAVAHDSRYLFAYRTIVDDVVVRSSRTGSRHYRWRPG